MYLLVHEIFAAKEQQDAKTWLNIIKPPTQWSGAYFLGIAAIFCGLIIFKILAKSLNKAFCQKSLLKVKMYKKYV